MSLRGLGFWAIGGSVLSMPLHSQIFEFDRQRSTNILSLISLLLLVVLRLMSYAVLLPWGG